MVKRFESDVLGHPEVLEFCWNLLIATGTDRRAQQVVQRCMCPHSRLLLCSYPAVLGHQIVFGRRLLPKIPLFISRFSSEKMLSLHRM